MWKQSDQFGRPLQYAAQETMVAWINEWLSVGNGEKMVRLEIPFESVASMIC